MMDGAVEHHVLEVYVTGGCPGCDVARELVANVRVLALSGIKTRLIDLDAPGAQRPLAVFAVLTYLLDSRVVSLGNPDQTWLVRRLEGVANTADAVSDPT